MKYFLYICFMKKIEERLKYKIFSIINLTLGSISFINYMYIQSTLFPINEFTQLLNILFLLNGSIIFFFIQSKYSNIIMKIPIWYIIKFTMILILGLFSPPIMIIFIFFLLIVNTSTKTKKKKINTNISKDNIINNNTLINYVYHINNSIKIVYNNETSIKNGIKNKENLIGFNSKYILTLYDNMIYVYDLNFDFCNNIHLHDNVFVNINTDNTIILSDSNDKFILYNINGELIEYLT